LVAGVVPLDDFGALLEYVQFAAVVTEKFGCGPSDRTRRLVGDNSQFATHNFVMQMGQR
jgi:hypothetical protein